nr:P2Y purinoceptor 11-like [Paramormyrops kingsleyae]
MKKTDFSDGGFQIKFLPPVFGLEFCTGLLGNAFALWMMVTRERRDWHSGVVFSCNLAISDLLYIFTLPMLLIYYMTNKDWTFGTAACKTERFLFICNLYGSIFFITCISLNRYLAIVHPFFAHRHVRPHHAKVTNLLAWVVVALMSSPVLRFAHTCKKFNTTECVSYCLVEDQRAHFTYSIFLAVFGGLLPFVVTLVSYGAIMWVVWRNQNITALEKRKVALLVVSVLLLYAVSVIPYHIFRNWHLHQRMHDINVTKVWVYKAYQVTKGLVTLSMCIHPILYMAVFDSIRTACCGSTEVSQVNQNETENEMGVVADQGK